MVDKEEVRHIAKLARIQLTQEEVERYGKELSGIVEYFEVLKEANTQEVWPMTHALPVENIAREDMPKREAPEVVSAMFKLAPAVKEGFLKVKTILSFK